MPEVKVLFENTEQLETFKTFIIEILESLYKELSGDSDIAGKLKIHSLHIQNFSEHINRLKESFSSENIRSAVTSSPPIRRLLIQKFSENVTSLQRAVRGHRSPEYTLTLAPLPELPALAVQHIQNFFSRQVKYLGPLRDEPKPVYPLAGATDPQDIGFKGEHTAAVLDVHRNTVVRYIRPLSINSGQNPTVTADALGTAVLDWLEYMGVASNLKTIDKGKLGHELKVGAYEGESLHDLTHVGVGVSQVLPILVLSLLADTGSTLIFEQPELHLHPRVQTRLADFFVSMTTLKKQCIVETHSEYLINRLRYRAAIADDEEVPQNTIMYFVEKSQGHSTYRAIRMNRFGVIEDWPKGFFDENEENAANILKASMKKRKKEKQI
jgi:predicted ATPase